MLKKRSKVSFNLEKRKLKEDVNLSLNMEKVAIAKIGTLFSTRMVDAGY